MLRQTAVFDALRSTARRVEMLPARDQYEPEQPAADADMSEDLLDEWVREGHGSDATKATGYSMNGWIGHGKQMVGAMEAAAARC